MRLLDELGGGRAVSDASEAGGGRTGDAQHDVLDATHLLAAPSLEALLARVGEVAQSLLGASHARVHLYDADAGELWAHSPAGRERVPAGEGPRARALRSGHVVRGPGGPSGQVLCAPLRGSDGRVIGLLEVAQDAAVRYDRSALLTVSLLARQAAIAVQRFLLQSAADRAGPLPGQAAVPGLEALGWTRPASLAGGDCFDYWRLPDGRLALFLGDASGNGRAGAVVIAQVRSLLRGLADVRPDPAWLLARANQRLQEHLESSRFVTAFMGCLGPDGRLEWCSAGQGPVYVRTGAEGEYQPLHALAPALGIDPELPTQPARPLRLSPGGRVVVLTDGILQADNGAGHALGPLRVKTVLDNTAGLPLDKVVELVRDVLFTWQGSSEAAGDQSMLVAGLAA